MGPLTGGSTRMLNLIFVIKNANAVPWEKALARAQVGSEHRPLLVGVCLIVCVKWVGGRSLVVRTQVSISQNILTMSLIGPSVGSLSREAEGEGRADISVVPFFKSPFQQWMMENSSVYGKSLGGYEQKIIPTARRKTYTEELGISNMKMNLNYLNGISLLSPFPLPRACVFQNWNLLPLFPSLSQGTQCVLRWKNTCLGVHCLLLSSLCPWFPPVFRIPLFAGTIKELSTLLRWLPINGLFLPWHVYPDCAGIHVSCALLFIFLLFWAPWGWGPCAIHVHIPSTGALPCPDKGLRE